MPEENDVLKILKLSHAAPVLNFSQKKTRRASGKVKKRPSCQPVFHQSDQVKC